MTLGDMLTQDMEPEWTHLRHRLFSFHPSFAAFFLSMIFNVSISSFSDLFRASAIYIHLPLRTSSAAALTVHAFTCIDGTTILGKCIVQRAQITQPSLLVSSNPCSGQSCAWGVADGDALTSASVGTSTVMTMPALAPSGTSTSASRKRVWRDVAGHCDGPWMAHPAIQSWLWTTTVPTILQTNKKEKNKFQTLNS